jgi:hypothetical protein
LATASQQRGALGIRQTPNTDDAMYHNIRVAPVTSKDAIRQTIAGFRRETQNRVPVQGDSDQGR